MVSYVPKKNKNVLLLTSAKCSPTTDDSSQKKKPHLILEYNKKKGGVDIIDQMLRHFSTKMSSCRWPLAVFCNILDITMLNAFVLWKEISSPSSRFLFIHDVAIMLLESQKERRSPLPWSPSAMVPENARKRGNCNLCDRTNRNKTQNTCFSCKKFVCGRHTFASKHLCLKCSD